MRRPTWLYATSHILALVALLFAAGCATSNPSAVRPGPIIEAREQIPEEQLLEVGIKVFEPGEMTEEQVEEAGVTEDIRKAETYFIPYHLKATMQRSGHWGPVRVVPDELDYLDLQVHGEIEESNAEKLRVHITAVDATGRVWLERTYEATINQMTYKASRPPEWDVFQSVYHDIANDLVLYKNSLSPEKIEEIRTTSQIRFAADFAPTPFANYVEEKDGRYRLRRLPSEDDPMLSRLTQIRQRENMYVDTLDEYYEDFFRDMRDNYDDWRKFTQQEMQALREVKRKSLGRIVGGVGLIATAIALEAAGVRGAATLGNVLVLGGGAVIVDGINVAKEAGIHRAGIEELGESFSSEMETVVVDLEGKQYELQGSVEEQYRQWRALLHELYEKETGFKSDDMAADTLPTPDAATP